MPTTTVLFFKDVDGSVPLKAWLDRLIPKARAKCVIRLGLLREQGHELRRPQADYLHDGIYELRVGLQGVNYRMLYFFHGRNVAVVTHGLTKTASVPDKEIDSACSRRRLFERSPAKHAVTE